MMIAQSVERLTSAILLRPLTQEGQLPVTDENMDQSTGLSLRTMLVQE